MTHPNIDRLNELLKKHDLGLPSHRTQVNASGFNLKFLRKTLSNEDRCPVEIKELLAMPDKVLMMTMKKAA